MTLQRIHFVGAAPTTSLVGGITNSATSFTVAAGTGYPTVGPFVVVIDKDTALEEKVLCASITGTTIAVSGSGRGYDNTTAAAHSNGAAVQHVLSANVVDDFSDHVYNTGRDDHTEYALTTGARSITGPQVFASSVTVDGTLTAAAALVGQSTLAVTGAATLSSTLAVSGASTLASAAVTNNETVGGTLGVTGATTLSSTLAVTGTVTGSSTVTGTALIPSGLSGATTAVRYVGGTATGAPGSGTFVTGDFVNTQDGHVFVCTSGGSPGTWVDITLVGDDAAWTNISGGVGFTNSWVDYASGGTLSCGFRKVHGKVYLRGAMKSGTVNSSAFTLPAGYRPSGTLNFVVSSNSLYGNVAIASSGNTTLTTGSNAWASLDGIVFDTL
jgi:hypothetical protein